MSPEAQRLLRKLTLARPHREVYIARDLRGWRITHERGQVSTTAIMDLVYARLIRSVYSNCPCYAYHVGQTIDVEATKKVRLKGNSAPLVYVDDAL